METEASNATRSLDRTVLQDLFQECEWVHLALGLLGNVLFFGGSVLFLFEGQAQTYGVWAFVIGSFLMLVGSIGEAVVKSAQDGS